MPDARDRLPVEDIQFAQRVWSRLEEHHRPQAIGIVGIAHQVGRVALLDAPTPLTSSSLLGACDREILDQIAPRLVDVWIDHVGRDGRRLQGELDPDVAADLPDVDLLAPKADRTQPETGVVALMDAPARLLRRYVLRPAKEIGELIGG